MKKAKKYFSFFGILLSTCRMKLQKDSSKVESHLINLPKITKELLQNALKPIKLYSTNNIK